MPRHWIGRLVKKKRGRNNFNLRPCEWGQELSNGPLQACAKEEERKVQTPRARGKKENPFCMKKKRISTPLTRLGERLLSHLPKKRKELWGGEEIKNQDARVEKVFMKSPTPTKGKNGQHSRKRRRVPAGRGEERGESK